MKSPLSWLLVFLVLIAGMALLGPPEKTLGSNVRVVYLHGAWVWAALAGFLAAAVTGLAGLLSGKKGLHGWSRALGRTGLVFWISYIPISMWAMQTNWNGLFLAEPRFRLALVFAVSGLLLQLGLALLDDPSLASAGNLAFFVVLLIFLRATPNVMHPPAPILDSDALKIQAFFGGLLLLTLLAGWQIARWWYRFETV